jgi:glycosyltransferase involved in cell wall biosynthesis
MKNASESILKCLKSISLDHQNAILVIDDNSTDNSSHLVKKFEGNRALVIDSSGFGISDALNTGIKSVMSKIVMRLDSDDLNLPNRDARYLQILNQYHPDLIFSNVSIFPKWKMYLRPRVLRNTNSEHLDWLMLVSNVLVHPTACINMEYLVDKVQYNHRDGVEDYLLWIELLKEGRNFYFLHEKLLRYDRSRPSMKELQSRNSTFANPTLEAFLNFQIHKLGFKSENGANFALSGGASRVKITSIIMYYFRINVKAPWQILPNLLLNQSIMLMKTLFPKGEKF